MQISMPRVLFYQQADNFMIDSISLKNHKKQSRIQVLFINFFPLADGMEKNFPRGISWW